MTVSIFASSMHQIPASPPLPSGRHPHGLDGWLPSLPEPDVSRETGGVAGDRGDSNGWCGRRRETPRRAVAERGQAAPFHVKRRSLVRAGVSGCVVSGGSASRQTGRLSCMGDIELCSAGRMFANSMSEGVPTRTGEHAQRALCCGSGSGSEAVDVGAVNTIFGKHCVMAARGRGRWPGWMGLVAPQIPCRAPNRFT